MTLPIGGAPAGPGRWPEGDSLWDRLGDGGTFGHAAAVLALCSPDLVEARGCVLMAERFDQANFATWWDKLDGRGPDVERVINHVHLWDVFTDVDDVAEPVLERFAEELADVWRAVLAHRFPDRTFVVEVTGGPDEYGPTLTFFQTPA